MSANPSVIRGVGFTVACILSVVAAIHLVNLTMDDAFISFRYSENLAAGLGLVFNPGERVEGYTNFLWTVLMAVPAVFGAGNHDVGMLVIGKLLSLAFTLGSVALVCWDTAPTSGQRRLALLPLGALFLVTTAPTLVWSVGALEGPMVGFLIAFSVKRWLAELDRPVRISWSAVLLALAAMTRPEPAVLIGPMLALRIITSRQSLPAAWREHGRYLLAFAVPFGLFLLWRYSYYGSLVPNTYYAKLHGDETAQQRGIEYLSDAFVQMSLPSILALAVPLALLARGERRRVLLLLVLCTVQFAGVAYEGGDWMPAARLLVPSLPLVALLINSAWRGAVHFEPGQLRLPALPAWLISIELHQRYNRGIDLVRAHWTARVGQVVSALLAASLIMTVLVGGVKTVSDWAGRPGSGFSAIKIDGGLHFEVARWMKQNVHEPGLLATGEIGVVPYYTKLPVLDLFGLTDAHLARREGTRHSKFDLQYVLDRAPKYVYFLMHPSEPGKPRRAQQNHGRVLLGSPQFQEHYAVLHDFDLGILYQRRP
jgi:hypothetical protein